MKKVPGFFGKELGPLTFSLIFEYKKFNPEYLYPNVEKWVNFPDPINNDLGDMALWNPRIIDTTGRFLHPDIDPKSKTYILPLIEENGSGWA